MSQPLPLPSNSKTHSSDDKLDLAAKIEYLRNFHPYIQTQRDLEYFSWLDMRRDTGYSGLVMAPGGSNLSMASQYYQTMYVKRKGVLYEIPMPVVYVEAHHPGRPKDLFISILESVGHHLLCSPLHELRKRTWGTLKSFGVELLLIDFADYLTEKALMELVHIQDHCNISVILLGSYSLGEIFKNLNSNIHNHFLWFHDFRPLLKEEFHGVVQAWESSALKYSGRLNLWENDEILSSLHDKTKGIIKPLYALLSNIAIANLKQSYDEKILPKYMEDLCANFIPIELKKK